MDEKTLNEAVENISLIRGIIDRTSKSFVAFSKIFIYWGLLFILNSIITLFVTLNIDKVMDITVKYPLLNYFFPIGLIAVLAFVIYRVVSKKLPLVGLEKHLMKVWLLVLFMNVLPPKIMITAATGTDIMGITVRTSRFSVMVFSLAIALIVTSLFTDYKQLGIVGIVYIAVSVLYAYTRISIFEGTIVQFLSFIVIPFTFLYTGIFLKTRQARGN